MNPDDIRSDARALLRYWPLTEDERRDCNYVMRRGILPNKSRRFIRVLTKFNKWHPIEDDQ